MALLAMMTASSQLAAAAPSARPHILMMLADDWSALPPAHPAATLSRC